MSDDLARRRIRSELSTSFVVEASAGTGKTTELVHRIVAVLASGAEVGRIAAVTFTDKAAGELKLRLRSQLEIARRVASHDALAALERSLARLEEARVSTIHTFAADILRERPVEAGVDPGFLADGEVQAELLFEQAFDEWLHRALERPGPALTRALARKTRGSKAAELLRAATTLRRVRHLPRAWERRPWDRETDVARALEEARALAAMSSDVNDERDPLHVDLEPVRALVTAIDRGHRLSAEDIEARIAELVATRSFASPRKGRGAYGPTLERATLLERHAQACAVLAAFTRAAGADLASALRSELDEVFIRYAALKERRGVLDFDDLVLRARDLLDRSTDARRALQARISHVFVDEFQDTDPIQAAILLRLASEADDERDAFHATLAPGKLFVVGDPKQSIYRFRNADLGVYEIVKSRVLASGGDVLTLERSFRSVPGIQAFVNDVFSSRMLLDARAAAPAYAPLQPVRSPYDEGLPPVVLLPVPKPYGAQRIAKRSIEASLPEAVAAFIDRLLARGAEIDHGGARVALRASHICLLFKHLESFGESQAAPFGAALAARGIAHVLVGGRSFYDRDEIAASLTALEAIERPDDPLQVVATLRGLFFGLTDESIFEWKLRYGRIHPLVPPITAIPSQLEGVADALAILNRLHRLRNRRPFAETLRELFERTRAHVSLALLPNGEQALANVQHLSSLREEGSLSFRGFLDGLQQRAEKRVAGEAPILEEAGDGVRMMTVHRAKGLEFPVVVLADPTARMTGSIDRHVDATEGLGAVRIFGLAPWELVDNEALEFERERAEALRIAYVAATRARDMLVVPIVGDDVTKPDDGWLAAFQSALAPRLASARPSAPSDAFRSGPFATLGPFSQDSVLQRPHGDGPSRSTVLPGVYSTPIGSLLVWDPAALELDRTPAPRVRGADIIAPRRGATTEAEAQFRSFLEARARRLEVQTTPSRTVVTATHAAHGSDTPLGTVERRPISHVVIPRSPDRPAGPRFGDLVHQTLATIELSATEDDIARVVEALARIIGATDEEAAATRTAVRDATRHPVWSTFVSADEHGDLRREVPLACCFGGQILEGIVDVAYLDEGTWHVVDFKTDRYDEVAGMLAGYEKQVSLYAVAIERATGREARGTLLFL